MSTITGKVSQIIGPVIDVEFNTESAELPNIYDSLEIKKTDGSILILEVQQHIGEDTVRTISMDATDGLQRRSGSRRSFPRFGRFLFLERSATIAYFA